MKKVLKNQGFALPLVLVGVAVVIVTLALVAYFLYFSKTTRQPATSPQPTQTPARETSGFTPSQTDETANWKTYTNSDVGYQISHPRNIQPKESTLAGEALLGSFVPPAKINHMVTLIFSDDGKEIVNISSAINIDPNYGFDAKLLAEKLAEISASPAKVSEMVLGGNKAYIVEPEPSEQFSERLLSTIFINGKRPNSAYVINIGVELAKKETVDQILSTFKFLN